MAVKHLSLGRVCVCVCVCVCANAVFGFFTVGCTCLPALQSAERLPDIPCLVTPPLYFRALVLDWGFQGREPLRARNPRLHLLFQRRVCVWSEAPWVQVPAAAFPSEWSWASDSAVLGPTFLFWKECSHHPCPWGCEEQMLPWTWLLHC